MVSGREEILERKRLRSNLQAENLVLNSSKDTLSTVTVWKAEYVGSETHVYMNIA